MQANVVGGNPGQHSSWIFHKVGNTDWLDELIWDFKFKTFEIVINTHLKSVQYIKHQTNIWSYYYIYEGYTHSVNSISEIHGNMEI